MGEHPDLFCMISVGSSIFNNGLIRKLDAWAESRGMRIGYVMLSIPERHNIEVFNSLDNEAALSLAEKHGRECQEKLSLSDGRLISWKDICGRVHFNEAHEKLLEQYQNNRSFRAHCLSQTFSNLQPRFHEIGVKKKTDEPVRRSASYLLEELAIKVGAFESGAYIGEILPRLEMGIVENIYAGSYFPCIVSAKGFRVISLLDSGVSQKDYPAKPASP